MVQILENMLRACVIFFRGQWDRFLPLAELAYNNIYQSNIEMASFKALYGQRCRSPIRWFELGDVKLYGTDLVKDALEKVKLIQERLRTAQSRQKSYVDRKAHDLSFMVGEKYSIGNKPPEEAYPFGTPLWINITSGRRISISGTVAAYKQLTQQLTVAAYTAAYSSSLHSSLQ
ncbi:uncharacterized protein [Nicotiana tomentosiformis]|uniref:uncharacterized protein n=1 Tax=Nicotiana tomentosiformis TaxID=4098 RepID=UPI00388CB40C